MHRISVGSYNVHSCVGLDWRCAPSRVAAVLEELDCDIYALQEVHNDAARDGSRQLDVIAEHLGMEAVPGLRIVKGKAEYGNAVLTRFPILRVDRHDLSVPRLEPRGALSVELDAGDCRLRVIATHLGLSRRERRKQWQQLLAAVKSAPPEQPVVLVGDMNEWYPRSVMLRDAHRFLGESMAPPAFPSFAPILSLTRVWVRPASAIVSIEVHRSPLARWASDHLPLKAVVDVRELRTRNSDAEDDAQSSGRGARPTQTVLPSRFSPLRPSG